MVAFCDKALAYTRGLDRATFAADPMRYDATLRNLELIGEAATHVPTGVRDSAADVPWRLIVAVRNRLIQVISASTMTRCGASSTTTWCHCGPR
jgi:uncharacterized protein with HEPN domain